ncbi:MAG: hypothetical protein V7752_08690 [Halopseudomonas sp.]
MSQEKPKLTGYSLKICDDVLTRIKVVCAKNTNFKFQYDFFDSAVTWAAENKSSLQPMAYKKAGGYRSYYINETNGLLLQLGAHWDCATTRALYTAAIGFLVANENEDSIPLSKLG